MWVAPLPCASTPLWQLTQLPITPAWDIAAVGAPVAIAPVAVARPIVALPGAPKSGAATRPALCAAAAAVTTVPMVLRDAVVAATGLFAALPFQLFVLWQPLQSWPT